MRLHCYKWGEHDKPALLFLHGFMGSGVNWRAVVEQLVERFYVIAPDLPGHGRSLFEDSVPETSPKLDDEYSFSQTAQAVIDLLDNLAIEHCALIGYSMGGRLALYLATHFPERFGNVVLESASPGISDPVERAARKRWDNKIANQLINQPFSEFLDQWYAMPLFASLRRHPHFEQVIVQRMRNRPQQLARSMREMGTGSQPPLWDAWAQMEIETLLIVGEWDEKYVGISAEMSHLNSNARVVVVEQAGHNVHFERPHDYVAELENFLLTDNQD